MLTINSGPTYYTYETNKKIRYETVTRWPLHPPKASSPSDCEPKFDFEFPEEGPKELGIKRKFVLSSFGIYLTASP